MSDQREADVRMIHDLDRQLPAAEIVVQAEVSGMTVAFTAHCSENVADSYLDMVRRRIDRLRAYSELVGVRVDLAARIETLANLPQAHMAELKKSALDKLSELKKVAEEKARAVAQFTMHGRSQDITSNQMKRLAVFDDAVAKIEKDYPTEEQINQKYVAARANLIKEIEHCRLQETRQLAIISGTDRAEVMSVAIESLEAAE